MAVMTYRAAMLRLAGAGNDFMAAVCGAVAEALYMRWPRRFWNPIVDGLAAWYECFKLRAVDRYYAYYRELEEPGFERTDEYARVADADRAAGRRH